MFSAAYWAQAIERALKSAAQALLIVWGATQVNALSVTNWTTALNVVISAALVSLLTSLASLPFGPSSSPSLVVPAPLAPVRPVRAATRPASHEKE
ncbi:MAG: putative lactococcus lactis phage r1t holin [Streptosporangiaceae bacterium]|nr:putative lactococcus lactis phage r1t holin [Streptosporangiaceae bacterium]